MIIGLVLLPLDLLFLSANTEKVFHGGLIPLLTGSIVLFVILTWMKGERIVTAEREASEGSLKDFVKHIHSARPAIKRSPGTAIYISYHPKFAPLALHATAEKFHELPESILIVSVRTMAVAHIPDAERASFDDLSYQDGIGHITLSYGFHETINIPQALQTASQRLALDVNLADAIYFVSHNRVVRTKRRNMATWRKAIYLLLNRNALNISDYYHLPVERTEEMSSLIKL